jgi:hypothetical protein
MVWTVNGSDLTGGLRQSLLGIMTQINEVQTPLVSNLATSNAIQWTHSWPSDRIKKPATQNAVAARRGALITPDGTISGSLTQSSNYTQIISSPWAIDNTAINSNYAGIPDLIAYYKSKSLKYIANGLELSAATGTLAADDGTYGNRMQGLTNWATAGVVYTSASATVASTAFAASGETSILTVLQKLWDKGVVPDFAYMSSANKILMDLMTTKVVRNIYMDPKEDDRVVIPGMIAVYESSLGTIRLLFSQAAASGTIVFGVFDELALAYLNNSEPTVIPLGVQYDGYGFNTRMEVTLEARDPYSLGYLTVS